MINFFNEMKLEKVLAIVLILFYIVSNILVFPSIINALLSLLWIGFVPYCIGRPLLKMIIKLSRTAAQSLNTFVYDPLAWIIGTIFIIAIMLISLAIHINISSIFGPLLLIASLMLLFTRLGKRESTTVNIDQKRILVILIVLGLVFGLYVRSFSPFPLSPGTDLFNHMFAINAIIDSSSTNIPLIYFPSFDILIALGASIYNSDLNAVFWIGSVFLTILFAISSYITLYHFMKNKLLAILGVVVAVSFTEMGIASNLQYFYPASFFMSIFPIFLVIVDKIWKGQFVEKIGSKFVLMGIIYLFLILLHSFLGLIGVLVLSIYVLILYITLNHKRLSTVIRLITIILGVVSICYLTGLITFQLQYDFISGNLFESHHLYNTLTKRMNLDQWYTSQVTFVAIFGLLFLSFFKDGKLLAVSLIGIILFLIYFQQISYIHRIMPIERIFLVFGFIVIVSMPLILLKSCRHLWISKRDERKKNTNDDTFSKFDDVKSFTQKTKYPKFKYAPSISALSIFNVYIITNIKILVYVIVIYLVIFPILMLPYDLYLNSYFGKGFDFTNYTLNEMKAGQWIKVNTHNNLKIFSDPFTVIEMRGLTNRMNIEGIGWNTTVANTVKYILTTENASAAYNNLTSNFGRDLLIIISPRTAAWLQTNDYFVQDPVDKYGLFPGLLKFFDKKYYNIEYYNDRVIVFSIN